MMNTNANPKASSSLKKDILSFFPRTPSRTPNTSTPHSKNEGPRPTKKVKVKRLNPIPLCTSDPSNDFVLLGPHGIQEMNQVNCSLPTTVSTPAILPLTQEDLLYGALCGSKKTTRRRKRKSAYSRCNTSRSVKIKDDLPIPFLPSPSTYTPSPTSTWEPTHHNLEDSIAEAAKTFFGIEGVTDFQRSAIQAVFEKRNVFVIMPTGAGKSLCFQLPAVMREALGRFVLVVSPLIALMEDQILSLRQKKIPAMTFSGASCRSWTDVENGCFRLVYCSPEFVALHFERMISSFRNKILFIAIDECHCVSEWGHHFRPSYRGLSRLRSYFKDTPLMCLTATATADARTDIVRVFKLGTSTLHLRGTINRQNIYYKVCKRTKSILEDFSSFFNLRERHFATLPVDNSRIGPYSSTLIYVLTKHDAETLAGALKDMGVVCAAYHAGLSATQRSFVHRQFLQDDLQVVCATVAFGMGIDKPDIRRIIHWCLPSSLESYTQQSGRAGRDRMPSEAVIMWSNNDVSRTRNIILQPTESGSLSERYKQRLCDAVKLLDYVKTYVELEDTCRREYILNYFGDTVTQSTSTDVITGICTRISIDPSTAIVRCNLCDVCCEKALVPTAKQATLDLTEEVHIILRCILVCKERTGLALPCKIATGSQSKDIMTRNLDKADVFGKGSCKPFAWWKELINCLIKKNYLEEKVLQGTNRSKRQNHYVTPKLTSAGRQFLKSSDRFILQNPPLLLMTHLKRRFPESSHLNGDTLGRPSLETVETLEAFLRQELLKLRVQEARKAQCAPYMVLPMPSIEHIVRRRPSSIDSLYRYVPHIPALCSVNFLSKLLHAVQSWSFRFQQPVDVEENIQLLPTFQNEPVKQEKVTYPLEHSSPLLLDNSPSLNEPKSNVEFECEGSATHTDICDLIDEHKFNPMEDALRTVDDVSPNLATRDTVQLMEQRDDGSNQTLSSNLWNSIQPEIEAQLGNDIAKVGQTNTPPISSLINGCTQNMTDDFSTLYELSQSDIAEFDCLLSPYENDCSTPDVKTQF